VISDLSAGKDLGPAAIHEARRTVEALLRENRAADDNLVETTPVVGDPLLDPQPGDFVVSRALGVSGRVAEVRTGSVIIEAGGIKLVLASEDLTTPGEGVPVRQDSHAGHYASLPEMEVRPEVDLRGLRVDEVYASLLAAIDAAVVADLRRLVVIHGKGTGALKNEVARLVSEDSRIASMRPGSFDEGSFGVTVLDLKGDNI